MDLELVKVSYGKIMVRHICYLLSLGTSSAIVLSLNLSHPVVMEVKKMIQSYVFWHQSFRCMLGGVVLAYGFVQSSVEKREV